MVMPAAVPPGEPSSVAAVLRRRARALAQPAEAALPDGLELLVFRVGSERWAMETRHVREVLPLRGLTPLPGTPPFVHGIVNVRGRVSAVLDLRRMFGLPEHGLGDLHRIVLVELEGSRFGLLAGLDVGVQRIALAQLGPAPHDGAGAWLRGLTPDGVAVLDIERVCNDPRMLVDDEGEE